MNAEDRSQRRTRGALWVFIGVTAIALVIILRALWIEFGQTSITPPVVAGELAASQARNLLTPWARGWHSDAGIVSCTTSYRRDATADEAWTCQVYSPSAQSIALARVDGQGVTLLRETAALYPQPLLPDAAWQTDSGKAIQVWWRNGGRSAWSEHSGNTLHLRLGSNATGVPTWQITLDATSRAQMAYWEISAESADLLQVIEEGAYSDVP